ncbi:MAG: 4Fe-4S binding protein, partial [Candidatus Thorarchaeota archaeon]|nr:4Fe-4S binding protein [Candidatus Thorarchaeota archaeon]
VPIAQAAVEGGADALSAINTIESLIGIDVETATPLPIAYGADKTEQLSTYGGFCGPAVRPVGLRVVSQIAKAFPDTPISGIGGIDSWTSAAEYLMVGARTLQICTAVMWHGFSIIRTITDGMTKFMERKGYETLEELVGLALPKITTWSALSKLPPIVAKVINEKCTGCKNCIIACADGGYVAIQMRDGVAVINQEKCDGCGLCAIVCGAEAIEFVHTR